jgi:CDP-diacylglycerol--glycerol-3-phosphate 3-phosphatidyltransferase
MRQAIPWAMIIMRAIGAPLIVYGAELKWAGGWLSLIVLLALLSDIFDGVLARRWGKETPGLRVWDSVADTIFYLGVVGALWLREPQTLRENWKLFAVLFGLEGFRYIFDFIKYRKAASYHSYLAKCWGLTIGIAVIGVLSFGGLRWLISMALVMGIVVNLEGLTMSLLLPSWQNDVKTLGRASKLRKRMLAEQTMPR